jgi:hypothetical protein
MPNCGAAYSCPVCGVRDPNAYLRCNRPDCTDGRDYPGRVARGEVDPTRLERKPLPAGVDPARITVPHPIITPDMMPLVREPQPVPPKLKRYMGQIIAECGCPQPDRCEVAQCCIAETLNKTTLLPTPEGLGRAYLRGELSADALVRNLDALALLNLRRYGQAWGPKVMPLWMYFSCLLSFCVVLLLALAGAVKLAQWIGWLPHAVY